MVRARRPGRALTGRAPVRPQLIYSSFFLPLLLDDARAAHPAELAAEGGVAAADAQDERLSRKAHRLLDAPEHGLLAALLLPRQPSPAHGEAKHVAQAL